MKAQLILMTAVLISMVHCQPYADCEIWLYRSAPSADNIFDTSLVSEIATNSQETMDVIYDVTTPFRYYALRNCPGLAEAPCRAFTLRSGEQIGVPSNPYPENDVLYRAPFCASNFILVCAEQTVELEPASNS